VGTAVFHKPQTLFERLREADLLGYQKLADFQKVLIKLIKTVDASA
jgi:hypothetical protein